MKAIMVVGTTSHAGKSFLTAALCRTLARQGWRVAPFKGQNMALNAYVTSTGGEIGYAQAVQAWAAGIIPRVEMNPILLKPQGNMTSQVIMKGKAVGTVSAIEYYEKYFDLGWEMIQDSLYRLSLEFDVIICEGAGSPAEINLKHRDLTNMRVAKHLNASTILIADIERGGVFAHIVGTLELLEPEERSLIKGIVINKFRGHQELLASGIEWLEKHTGIPVLGVIPWIDNALPSEDSLDLLDRKPSNQHHDLNISVVRLPRISNFTDFDPLEAEATVGVRYVALKDSLGHPDAVIIPGSKTTISDLIAMEQSGMAKQLQEYAAAGGTVIGICGGFQMLGQRIIDPEGYEGEPGEYRGLGLLPVTTILSDNKIARQRQVFSHHPQAGLPVDGYEIHLGRTRIPQRAKEVEHKYQPIFDDPGLGLVDESRSIWGCYLHGLFDNGPWRRSWLNHLRKQRGMSSLATGIANYREQREMTLNSLADIIKRHLNLKSIISNDYY
ncbi:MAG: cobyric acid synthase CobQ [Xenococcaceae cyanobacterium MO_207.B15]|nr:cobyric acid synthase CobQ [Xenococcaceae cyanobacterium MO_207.B15]MDJ0744601.1 cobyric acid synthase CobQ [Xenococcaceae cyanobacterium MO_167.B27]